MTGLFNAVGGIFSAAGQNISNNLLKLQMENEALRAQRAQAEASGTALSTLFGGYDPQTGVSWDTGRPGLTDVDKVGLLTRAFPTEVGKAQIERLFPGAVKPIAVPEGGALVDPGTGKEVYHRPKPSPFGISPLGGGQSPGAGLQSVVPNATPAPAPALGPRKPPPAETPLGDPPAIFADLIRANADRTGLPPDVVGRQMLAESSGNPNAVSAKGAKGLMQIMDATAADPGFGVRPKRDNSPEEQLRFSTDYLAALRDYYAKKGVGPEDALKLALGAYNWGYQKVDRWLEKTGGDPNKAPAEVVSYVRRVMGPRATAPAAAAPPAAPPQTAGQTAQPAPTAQPQLPANAAGYLIDNQKGGFVPGRTDGMVVVVDANGVPVGEAPPPGSGGSAGPMFGKTEDALAVEHLVRRGVLTSEQGAQFLASKSIAGPNGRVDLVSPTGAVTAVRDADLSPQERETLLETDRKVEAGAATIGLLRRALELNPQAMSGPLAGVGTFADRFIPGDWGGTATTEYSNIVLSQALENLKAIFGAAPTEGERKILLDLQGSVEKSPAERKVILSNAIEAAERRMTRETERAAAMRSKTYYKEGLPPPVVPQGGNAPPTPAADPAAIEAEMRRRGLL